MKFKKKPFNRVKHIGTRQLYIACYHNIVTVTSVYMCNVFIVMYSVHISIQLYCCQKAIISLANDFPLHTSLNFIIYIIILC